MNDLKPYVVFAETAAAGSMSAAARRLKITPSAVSQIIAGLERRFGVSLLRRSTRRLALTEAGERCLPHCLRMIEAASAAAMSLEQARDAPAGELRISAPIGFGVHLAPALAPLLAEWPDLTMRLILADELIDLVEARVDLALRVGPLPDTDWIGHKLPILEMAICASPRYLDRCGTPTSWEELERHDRLALERNTADRSHPGGDQAWEARPAITLGLNDQKTGSRLEVPLRVRVLASNQVALQQICEQGMGLACLPIADVRNSLQRGVLIHLLPNYSLTSQPVFALTSSKDGEPAKVRVALAALLKHFSTFGVAA